MIEAITLVEIDVDRCTLVYGDSPCTAALGVTGDRKCYNTRATCQDPNNYDPEPKTCRYAVASDLLSRVDQGDLPAIPSVISVDHTPARIRIAEDLGERASVRVSFVDHPDSDFTQDPYISERPNPPGTYWGRFRARNKYLLGRPLRWIEGSVGQAISDMQTRRYIIEAIEGPDVSGRVTIIAKDVLKLADGPRAQAPALSTGTLSANLDKTTTSITLNPAGIGNLEYDGVELVAIGDEILRVTGRAGDVLTVTRGQEFTDADDHEEDDRVQIVRIYAAERSSDIIYDLLVNDAGIPASAIDLTAWNDIDDAIINRVYSARIAEPTPVKQLVGELMEQAGISIFVDELAGQVRFVPLRELATPVTSLSDDVMVQDSLSIREQPEQRISQVWLYYGQRNPLENLNKESNFSVARLLVSLDAESPDQYGQSAIRKIYSRWIPKPASLAANDLATILIERFRDPPRLFRWDLQRNGTVPLSGQTASITSRVLQRDDGTQDQVPVTIISRADSWRGHSFEGEEFRVTPFDPTAPQFIELLQPVTGNINLRAIYDLNVSIPPDGSTVIVFRVNPGVTVGGNVFGPTIDTGSWPSGASLTLEIFGSVIGRGGTGGIGAFGFAGSGQAGSTAIRATSPIDILNEGTIAGGGGGGGGASGLVLGDPENPTFTEGAGGGGGAGVNAGLAGSPGGQPGTATTGGAGGVDPAGPVGGAGGALATAGSPGVGGSFGAGSGGAAGAAIDGISLVTLTGSGTVIGATI